MQQLDRESIKRVVAYCGGSGQRAAATNAVPSTVEVYVDVAKEVDLVRGENTDSVFVSLAVGETVYTLADKAVAIDAARYTPVRDLLAGRPGDLSVGLGQTPALGPMALEVLGRELDEIIATRIYNPLLIESNGDLRAIELIIVNSLAGGTGKGVSIELAKRIVGFITSRGRTTVTVKYFQVGGISFTGLGNHIDRNVGVGVMEVGHQVQSSHHHAREVREGTFTELPIVGRDSELRGQLMALLVQAWFSRGVQEHIGRASVNAARTTEFGRMLSIRPSWRTPVDAETIRAGAVAQYLPELRQLAQATGNEPITFEITDTEEAAREVNSDEDVLLGVRNKRNYTDTQLGELMRPTGPKYRAFLRVNEGSVEAFIGRPPTNMVDFRSSMVRSNALSSRLENETSSQRAMGTRLEGQANTARAEAIKAYHAYVNPGWRDKVRKEGDRFRAFGTTFMRYRALAREAMKFAARTVVCDRALTRVDELRRQRLQQPLQQIITAMEAQAGEEIRGLVYRPLQEVFMQLMARAANRIELTNYLESQTLVRVSLTALRHMVGAMSDDPSVILESILGGKPAYHAPWWGAEPRGDVGRTYVVLPPLAPEDLDLLREIAPNGVEVTCSDTTGAGTAVVLIEAFWTHNPDQVLTGHYETPACELIGTPDEPLVRVNPSEPLWPERVGLAYP